MRTLPLGVPVEWSVHYKKQQLCMELLDPRARIPIGVSGNKQILTQSKFFTLIFWFNNYFTKIVLLFFFDLFLFIIWTSSLHIGWTDHFHTMRQPAWHGEETQGDSFYLLYSTTPRSQITSLSCPWWDHHLPQRQTSSCHDLTSSWQCHHLWCQPAGSAAPISLSQNKPKEHQCWCSPYGRRPSETRPSSARWWWRSSWREPTATCTLPRQSYCPCFLLPWPRLRTPARDWSKELLSPWGIL